MLRWFCLWGDELPQSSLRDASPLWDGAFGMAVQFLAKTMCNSSVLFVGGRTLSVSHTLDSSPEGGAFRHLPASRAKPPPFGGGGKAVRLCLREFQSP